MNRVLIPASPPSSIFFRGSSNSPTIQYIIWILLLLAPLLMYCLTIFRNAYNFPYEDDFNSALSFVTDFVFNKTSPSERFQLLFSQYNEHRIVFDRLVFLGDYYFFGTLNFRRLTLLGNVSVLLLALLFIKLSFRTYPWYQRLFYLLPVAYSLFLFQYWELTTWAMAALSNFYVIVFTMFSLYQLSRPGKYALIIACGAAILATFTIGSGLLCFLAGIPILLLLKAYRRLGIWLAVGAITILFYFRDYNRPPYHPDITDALLNHPGQATRYLFSLIGAFFPNHPVVSLLFGLMMLISGLGLLVYLWRTHRLTENLPLLGLLIFLYLTCLSITAGRSGFGVQQAYSTRYGFITVVLYATQAVLTIETIRNSRLRIVTTLAYGILAMLFFVSGTNVQHRRDIELRSARLHQLALQYQLDPQNTILPWGNPEQAKIIFNEATSKGIFRLILDHGPQANEAKRLH